MAAEKVQLRKGERTRARIVEAAVARFGRDGYRATSVAAVARDADVGETVPFRYFPTKDDLFAAALDHDASGLVEVGLSHVEADVEHRRWRETIMPVLAGAVADYPLAHRVLRGLEPEATARFADLPALDRLRDAVADQLRAGQADGTVRPDIDATTIADGAVVVVISLLMTVLQFRAAGDQPRADGVLELLAAAIDPPSE